MKSESTLSNLVDESFESLDYELHCLVCDYENDKISHQEYQCREKALLRAIYTLFKINRYLGNQSR